MKRYRTFFRYVFRADRAGPYLRRCCKGLPPPGSYAKRNQHGGVMPALPGDFQLSGRQAAIVLEKVADSEGVSYEQLRGVSGMLSYLRDSVSER